MNQYFKMNMLKNNLQKTQLMIISDSKELKDKAIVLEDKLIENQNKITGLTT